MPLMEPTVASKGLPLVQVPPAELVYGIDAPVHIVLGPDIGAGEGITVTTAVCWHPAPSVYTIVAVPAVIPVTPPVADPMVILDVVLLQRPPAG